jgi:hypothetical protein
MKKYYKILDLEEGASKEEIEKRYQELSKEYDPKDNDNQEFFKEEYEKVQEAYKALITSAILKNPDKKPKVKPVHTESSANEDESEGSDDPPALPRKNPVKRESGLVRNVLLLFIATGIWGIFFQNMGFINVGSEALPVHVVNTVDTYVEGGSIKVDGGSIEVDGGYMSVEVDNTVSVSIDEVLHSNGKKYYFNN